jgi:FAD/FMN-containing dehydrogenase
MIDKKELQQIIDGDVENSSDELSKYSHDTSLFEVVPELIVYPKHSKDVSALVRYATRAKASNPKISLTGRSGGTDMSGGAINDSLIVVFDRYMHKVGPIRHSSVSAEPGVYYRNFEKKTLMHGLLMPSYPASREICAIGGMVSNNSGGEKSLAYGKTEDYVNSMSVVLADGNEYEFKALNKKQLDQKLSQHDFEGDIYRQMFKLLDENYDEIKAAKPPVTKNSTAYSLWNVWDREKQIFDMTQLFVGAQGTLGLMTAVNLRLIPVLPETGMVIAFAHSSKDLGEVINEVVKHKPTSFETFDRHTVKFAFKFFFQFRKTLGWRKFIRLGLNLIPDLRFFWRGLPELILLVEFEGQDHKEIMHKLHNMLIDLEKYDLDLELAPNKSKEERFWTMRRESFNLLRKNVKNRHTAPFIDDLVVPPRHLPEFLPKLNEILDRYNLLYTIAGHMGDGNFHIIPLMDLTDKIERDKIKPCLLEVIDLVKKYDGTISGEHNDGMIRGPFIEVMYGKSMFNHFKQIKNIFDPQNIFNPHKKVDAKWEFSESHIRDHF